jgi:hypothetical protein
MDNIVINISSPEVLDKLLVGKEEVILQIQKGVLSNWECKNLRPRIDQEVGQDLIKKLDGYIKKTIHSTISEEIKYEELEPVIRQASIKIINKMIDEELDDLIQKRVKFLYEKAIKKAK